MSLEKNKVIFAVVGIIAILLIGVFIVTNEQSSDNISDIVVEPEPVVQEPEPEPVVQEPEPEPVVPEPVREPDIVVPAPVIEAIAAGEPAPVPVAPDPVPPADPTEITINSVTVESNSVTVAVSITGDFDHWHIQLNSPLSPGNAGGIMVRSGLTYTFDNVVPGVHTVYVGAVDSMHYLISEQAMESFFIAELIVEPEPEPEPECPFGQEMAAGGECELVVLTEDVFMEIDGGAFEFSIIKIKKGVTVTWKTTEKELGAGGDVDYHQVFEVNGLFDSGPLSIGTKWSYTFNEVGEYNYICPPHPWMKATIIVVD